MKSVKTSERENKPRRSEYVKVPREVLRQAGILLDILGTLATESLENSRRLDAARSEISRLRDAVAGGAATLKNAQCRFPGSDDFELELEVE